MPGLRACVLGQKYSTALVNKDVEDSTLRW
jgi:hypothetical protein